MLRKLRTHFRQQFIGYLALFIALSGSAYAAATIGSGNIKNNAVLSRHIKDGAVQGADLGANSVGGGKVIANSLTGNDIDESTFGTVPAASHADAATHADAASQADTATAANTASQADIAKNADKLDGLDSADLVHGRGSLLSNRLVFVPGGDRTLLTVPGLGELQASCGSTYAEVIWSNTTESNVDVWLTDTDGGRIHGSVRPKNFSLAGVARAGSIWDSPSNGGTISLGIGNDPGPRRVATLQAFAYQSKDDAPCGFQAQGTLWTSP